VLFALNRNGPIESDKRSLKALHGKTEYVPSVHLLFSLPERDTSTVGEVLVFRLRLRILDAGAGFGAATFALLDAIDA
jgi:hypothetical protein